MQYHSVPIPRPGRGEGMSGYGAELRAVGKGPSDCSSSWIWQAKRKVSKAQQSTLSTTSHIFGEAGNCHPPACSLPCSQNDLSGRKYLYCLD